MSGLSIIIIIIIATEYIEKVVAGGRGRFRTFIS